MAGQVGKTVQLKVTEVNRARRRVIGSIRAVSSESRKAAQEKIWAEIENGKKSDHFHHRRLSGDAPAGNSLRTFAKR